jgi:hypothetical protein
LSDGEGDQGCAGEQSGMLTYSDAGSPMKRARNQWARASCTDGHHEVRPSERHVQAVSAVRSTQRLCGWEAQCPVFGSARLLGFRIVPLRGVYRDFEIAA